LGWEGGGGGRYLVLCLHLGTPLGLELLLLLLHLLEVLLR
jgi:hypothetical protein